MASVELLCTPEMTVGNALVSRYVECCLASGPDTVAMVVATSRSAEFARAEVLVAGLPGLFDPRIFTFPELAEAILVANHHPFRRVSDLQRQLLLDDIVRALASEGRLGELSGYVDEGSGLPGLVAAIGSVLDELKWAAVQPAEFAHAAGTRLPGHPANGPLSAVYERYQSRLKDLRLYDAPGLFWEALDILRAGRRRPLEDVQTLLVDGIAEFTTTQLHMLSVLCDGLQSAAITLPLDETRPDVFAVTLRTRERLVAAGLIASPPAPLPPGEGSTAPGVAVVAAPPSRRERGPGGEAKPFLRLFAAAGGVRAEVRELALRVKNLLLDDADPLRPEDIAVILRAFDGGHDLALIEVLTAYGIPFEISRGESIGRRPAVRAALDVLDVIADDWTRADVVKLLNNSYVDMAAPLDGGSPTGALLSADEFEAIALEARIIGGRESWPRQLAQLARRLESERLRRVQTEGAFGIVPDDAEISATLEDEAGGSLRPGDALSEQQARVERCMIVLSRLRELLDPLERARTWREAVTAFSRAVSALGITARAKSSAPSRDAARVASDLSALEALADGLRQLGEADLVLGVQRGTTAPEFCERVRRLCRETRASHERRTGTGVQILDVHTARQMRFRHVFIPGLTEGHFPQRRAQDPFYHDSDRSRLSADGLILEERLPAQQDEAFLFHSALATATDCVWLSYPTSDPGGAPLLTSYFVDEVLRTNGRDATGQATLEPEIRRLSEVVRPAVQACSTRELMEAAFLSLGRPGGATDPSGSAAVAACQNGDPRNTTRALRSAIIERARDSFRPLDEFDGVLSAPAIHLVLHSDALFGPGHKFSAGQFGDYGQCPMSFFLKRVLRLEALDEPTEDVQAIDLGLMAHRVLSEFFGQRRNLQYADGRRQTDLQRALGMPLSEDELPAETERLGAIITRVFANAERQGLVGHAKLWELARVRVERDLTQLLRFEAQKNLPPARGKGLPARTVWGVETVYGRDNEFDLGADGATILVHGRIDRVDILGDAGPFAVFDYKTGGAPTAAAIRQGRDFQLPLYCMAAEKLALPGERIPGFWAYYRVLRPVDWKSKAWPDDIAELTDIAREKVREHATGIRAGRFGLAPGGYSCRWCDFATICRYNAWRVAKKPAAESGEAPA